MNLDEMREYVASVDWIFAKTMAATPHEYTLRRKQGDCAKLGNLQSSW